MKTFQDGDPLFGAMMNAIANLWPNGTAVLSGCAPTGSGAARQVTVAAGTVVINGAVRSVSQQTKTLDAATFDRYDLLSVNSSGTVVVTKGTEERRVPALPANSVPIAICLVETGQTTLPADRIYDSRMDALRLSQIAIDADKDWGGKSIMNVGIITGRGLQATQKKSYAVSDTVIHAVPGEVGARATSPQTTHTATVPQGYMTSKFRVKFDYRGNGARACFARLLRNGRQVGDSLMFYNADWATYSVDLDDVEPGTVFQVQAWARDYGDTSYTRDLRICGEVETYIHTIGSSDVTW